MRSVYCTHGAQQKEALKRQRALEKEIAAARKDAQTTRRSAEALTSEKTRSLEAQVAILKREADAARNSEDTTSVAQVRLLEKQMLVLSSQAEEARQEAAKTAARQTQDVENKINELTRKADTVRVAAEQAAAARLVDGVLPRRLVEGNLALFKVLEDLRRRRLRRASRMCASAGVRRVRKAGRRGARDDLCLATPARLER